MSNDDHQQLSIGAMSQASGVPKQTIRTWERRYGFPDPQRNASGHRVYSLDDLERLRLVKEALDQGLRAGNVVGLDRRALGELVETTRPEPSAPTDQPDEPGPDWLPRWLSASADLDATSLERYLHGAWNKLGGIGCLDQYIGPFLEAVGEGWHQGRLSVAQEHFVSERVRAFLTLRWRPLSDRASGPRVVMATLPDEHHDLGLHMAAMVTAMGGCENLFLGSDTPVEEIVETCHQKRARAVLLSVSSAYPSSKARRHLGELADTLSEDVELLVGGRGRPQPGPRQTSIDNWRELLAWSERAAHRQ